MSAFTKSTSRRESAKTRNHGKKRCCRFSISIQNETEKKLKMLATSCGLSKSEMVDTILLSTLNSPSFVDQVQQHFNVNEKYKVKPIVINAGGKQQIIYD